MNHPFFDGKKRVAFFAVDVFLRLNKWKLEVEPKPAYTFLIILSLLACLTVVKAILTTFSSGCVSQ